MDYSTWSRCEAVPLSNGIVTRRTGLHYMKSPEEISAYYQHHFGTYWFDELPKTDNTYCPTSKYYGCTLAPGIPLIPNLCRRPLRSPGNGEYDYDFTSTSVSKTFSAEVANNHNSWIEKNNFSNNHDNGTVKNHLMMGMMKLPRRKIDFHDSGLDSDSDQEDSKYHRSQNSVTWLRWIITCITSVVTVITETVTGRRSQQNHINTRVPLKQAGGVSWYQYPVLWLYRLALTVHRADIWLLAKVNSLVRVDRWGTSQQRRKWALILLLIPLIIWAGYELWQWLWTENTSAATLPELSWLLAWLWGGWEVVAAYVSAAWGWFDGSWLWAPWVALTGWLQDSHDQVTEDVYVEEASVDWSELFSWPASSVAALWASISGLADSAVTSLGEGAVTVYTSVASFLYLIFTWLVDCVTSVPALTSSALALVAYPFKSISWEAAAPEPYAPLPAIVPAPYIASPAPQDSVTLDHVLRDKQLLALLVRTLVSSEDFSRALAERQSSSQVQVNSAVDAVLSKIDIQFTRVKDELNQKITSEEITVVNKMDDLKQQIHDLQMALMALKTLVSEQAALGNRLEARVTEAEQLTIQEGQEHLKLKEQVLVEVARIQELSGLLVGNQATQKVAADSGTAPPLTNMVELEALVNSTVERLLAIYDADKIAKVDYALASSGGSVLNVRCTETFTKKNAQYYMWGYPLWSKASNDPRIALEPAINPGECWAFSGSRGHLVIELSENITVSSFTMEHLPRSLSPSGTIDTAPKDFTVLGLESEQDDAPLLLGRFRYEDNGAGLQHYQALETDHAFKIVELVIESNHGNLEYTCLYRFRVHGQPVRNS